MEKSVFWVTAWISPVEESKLVPKIRISPSGKSIYACIYTHICVIQICACVEADMDFSGVAPYRATLAAWGSSCRMGQPLGVGYGVCVGSWGGGGCGQDGRASGQDGGVVAVPGGGGGRDGGAVAGMVGALGWVGMARAVGNRVVVTDPATSPSWPPMPPFWPPPPPHAVLATAPSPQPPTPHAPSPSSPT